VSGVPTSSASVGHEGWERTVPPASWLDGLPKEGAPAAAEQQAWAALPLNETGQARLALVRIATISGGQASVVDGMGHRHLALPRALLHPVGSSKGLKNGDMALCARWTTPSTVCRVEAMEGGRVLRAAYDWAGATKRSAIDHAEPLRSKLEPLAFASYPLAGRRARGQVVAASEQRVWLLGESGHVSKHPRHQLRVLAAPKTLVAGAAVYAYRWGAGYQRGRLVEVLEPGLRFRVDLEGDRPSDEFFVSHLSAPP
jgi:hypothetical protein